jgi:hypothetical protein
MFVAVRRIEQQQNQQADRQLQHRARDKKK